MNLACASPCPSALPWAVAGPVWPPPRWPHSPIRPWGRRRRRRRRLENGEGGETAVGSGIIMKIKRVELKYTCKYFNMLQFFIHSFHGGHLANSLPVQ